MDAYPAAPEHSPAAEAPIGRGAQARRDLILAAADAFAESSLEGATTRDIARRAGQNIAAITYYFGGKEGLYRAVVEHIVKVIDGRIGPLMTEIETFLAQDARSEKQALRYVKDLLAAAILSNHEIVGLTRIIAREQTRPTPAFQILYDGVLSRFQRLGATLIAVYADGDPDDVEFAVRFHALQGEAMAFRFARQTILQRTGWTDIGRAEGDLVCEVVLEHAEAALRDLRRGKRRR